MADFYVRNSLNSKKAVKFNIAIRDFVDVNTEGEEIWVLEIGTLTPDADGNVIPPSYVHNVTEENIEDEIHKVVSQMCSLIDWTVLENDNEAPQIISFSPTGENVDVTSFIEFSIEDALPSSGIDLSEMKVISLCHWAR